MEEDAAVRNLLCAVFGDSEDDGGEDRISGRREWERVEEIHGLWLCRDFLCDHKQEELINDIESESWFTNPNENQAMRFGSLPFWALNLSASIHSCVLDAQRSKTSRDHEILRRDIVSREPLFDQMIVNSYKPVEGIGAHVDLLRFEDGIVILSLVSSRVMTFKNGSTTVGVLLRPGDLLVMSGEARYDWTHEISTNPAQQMWDGVAVPQERRISVTLRRLCHQN